MRCTYGSNGSHLLAPGHLVVQIAQQSKNILQQAHVERRKDGYEEDHVSPDAILHHRTACSLRKVAGAAISGLTLEIPVLRLDDLRHVQLPWDAPGKSCEPLYAQTPQAP